MAETARDRLLRLHDEVCSGAKELMIAKNHDYASDADPFRNFRRYGALGILVRLSDKLSRLDSFLENKTLSVSNESVKDTVRDIVNYAILFEAYTNESTSDYDTVAGDGRECIRPVSNAGTSPGTRASLNDIGARIAERLAMASGGTTDNSNFSPS